MKDKSVTRKCQINYSIKEYSTAKTTAERLRLWPVLKLMWSFTWNPFSFFVFGCFVYLYFTCVKLFWGKTYQTSQKDVSKTNGITNNTYRDSIILISFLPSIVQ